MERKLRCYGRYDGHNPRCSGCDYACSCQIWQQTNLRPRCSEVSLCDEVHWQQTIDPWSQFYPTVEDREKLDRISQHRDEFFSIIGKFFRYLSRLSAPQLSILTAIIAKGGNGLSTWDLAQILGQTRQAVHKTIIKTIAERPELYCVFSNVINRMSSSRHLALRRRQEKAIKGRKN